MRARMRLEYTVLLALSVTTCGGKVVVDQGGTGGQGGSSSPSSSSSSSQVSASASSFANGDGSGGFSTGSDATTGDTGAGPPCLHCAEAISGMGDPGPLCPDSQILYDQFFGCACKTACPYQCGDNICQQSQPNQTCIDCIQQACVAELMGCIDDA